jgi:hypothetical protein
MSKKQILPIRLLKGFGMFWWDFLVGDTPELFIAALLIIGVIAGLRGAGYNTAAVVALPVLAVLALGVSVRRAINSSKKK